ncbi:hypothetical protein RCL1_001028 [Eukaryota sp. TZLM3-RCL]
MQLLVFLPSFVHADIAERKAMLKALFDASKPAIELELNISITQCFTPNWKRSDNWIVLKYSQGQRKFEGNWVAYDQQSKILKNQYEENYNQQHGENTCELATKRLSMTNKRSTYLNTYLDYVNARLAHAVIYMEHYQNVELRRIDFQRFRRTQKSEHAFIKRLVETFGPKEDLVVVFGDWTQSKTRIVRGRPPSLCVGSRLMLARGGLFVTVEDKWGTSINCFNCLLNPDFDQGRNDYVLRYVAAMDPIMQSRARRVARLRKQMERMENRDEK